jgi:hypothetical protein
VSFLILSLPRSRSAWLAHYLNYPMARPLMPVGHDILNECRDVQMFLDSYRHGMWGSIETGGASLWPIVRDEMPECRIILVRRPLHDVYRSLAAAGVSPDLGILAELDQHLNFASADPSITSVPYDLLSDPGVGKWVFEYCLELDWDEEWWTRLVQMNIQVDMGAWLERLESRREQYLAMLENAKKRMPAPPVIH